MSPTQLAWDLLKSRTIRNYPFNDDPSYEAGRAGNQTQYSSMVTGNTIPIVGGGVDKTQTDQSRHGGRSISSSTRRAREKVNMQQMMRNLSTPEDDAIEQLYLQELAQEEMASPQKLPAMEPMSTGSEQTTLPPELTSGATVGTKDFRKVKFPNFSGR
jgi:hypothetical protein